MRWLLAACVLAVPVFAQAETATPMAIPGSPAVGQADPLATLPVRKAVVTTPAHRYKKCRWYHGRYCKWVYTR